MSDKAVIAIDGRSLAIFGSNLGFLGPVIQNYAPFTDEAAAIEDAKLYLGNLGIPFEEKISRPRITSMRITTKRVKHP